MVGSVSNQLNPQIPAVNAFKPGPTIPEEVLANKDKFDDTPKTRVDTLQVRNEERREEAKAASSSDTYTGAATNSQSASSARGNALDITV